MFNCLNNQGIYKKNIQVNAILDSFYLIPYILKFNHYSTISQNISLSKMSFSQLKKITSHTKTMEIVILFKQQQ